MLAFIFNFLLGATATEQILQAAQDFAGPIILLVIAFVAITFLIRREMMQFVIFLVIGIVVLIIFYAPTVVKNLAGDLSEGVGLEEDKTGW